MSLELPDLTLADGHTKTMRKVLSRYLRRQLDDLLGIQVGLLPTADRPLFSATISQLRRLSGRDRGRALSLFRLPTINALVATSQRQSHAGGDHQALAGWMRELCLLLLLEMSLRQVLSDPVCWRADGRPLPRLHCLGAGLSIAFSDIIESLEITNEGLSVRAPRSEWTIDLRQPPAAAPPGAPWQLTRPYHAIVPGVWLAEVDNNPLSDFEAHPDKQGNRLDLGGKSVAEWLQSLRAAFALIDTHLPLLGEELRLVATLVVPVGHHDERHLSASYQEVIGTAYMTLHPDLMTMTEAVVHEFQHNKLNAAMHLDPLLHNAFSPLFASPVRPDPRPLHGVILAVHAFQPVARLYRAMVEAGHPRAADVHWRRRFAAIVAGNYDGTRTVLAHAAPTEAGRGLLAEMNMLDAQAQSWGLS